MTLGSDLMATWPYFNTRLRCPSPQMRIGQQIPQYGLVSLMGDRSWDLGKPNAQSELDGDCFRRIVAPYGKQIGSICYIIGNKSARPVGLIANGNSTQPMASSSLKIA